MADNVNSYMFSLSTAWNANKHSSGRKIVEEILKLGIKKLELNFSLTKKMVDEIAEISKRGKIEITSLHNYCPIPKGFTRKKGLPDCLSLSSINESERQEAVKFTKLTIATAKRLSAKAVVLHCGRVEIEDKTRHLIHLHNCGLKKSKDYKKIFKAFVLEREKKSGAYFSQILKSLQELCNYAEKSGIILGLENRFYYREIPSFKEFGIIFKKIKNKHLAYWHDVGHGYILEKLGFMQEGALLEKYSGRLYGFHLHNIKNLNDHQAPVEGDFDFYKLKPYIGKKTLKIIEAHNSSGPEAIKKSVIYLTETLNPKRPPLKQ